MARSRKCLWDYFRAVNCHQQVSGYIFGTRNDFTPVEGLSPMAQKVKVTVVCDLPHDGEVEGEETVQFSFDGAAYEIDVCAKHAKELRDKVSPFVDHARKASTVGRRRRARGGPGRERSAEIKS